MLEAPESSLSVEVFSERIRRAAEAPNMDGDTTEDEGPRARRGNIETGARHTKVGNNRTG